MSSLSYPGKIFKVGNFRRNLIEGNSRKILEEFGNRGGDLKNSPCAFSSLSHIFASLQLSSVGSMRSFCHNSTSEEYLMKLNTHLLGASCSCISVCSCSFSFVMWGSMDPDVSIMKTTFSSITDPNTFLLPEGWWKCVLYHKSEHGICYWISHYHPQLNRPSPTMTDKAGPCRQNRNGQGSLGMAGERQNFWTYFS